MYKSVYKKLIILGLLSCITACETTTKIQSFRDNQPSKNIKKITILQSLPSQSDGNSGAFVDNFQTKLSKCGVQALSGAPISPFMTRAKTIEQTKRSDHPDAILLVTPENIHAVSINNTGYTPRSAKIIFTLVNPDNDKDIWKAKMDAEFNNANSNEAGNKMANDIFKKLMDDGILPRCTTTE